MRELVKDKACQAQPKQQEFAQSSSNPFKAHNQRGSNKDRTYKIDIIDDSKDVSVDRSKTSINKPRRGRPRKQRPTEEAKSKKD